jgi:hypothetical protein
MTSKTTERVSATRASRGRSKDTPYGARKDGFRSGYEAQIAKRNPYLLYEPNTYSLEIVNFDCIPAVAVEDDGEGALTIDASWVTRGTRRKTDKPWVTRRNHTPDWEIPANLSSTGSVIVVESKGLLTVDNRALIRAFRACYPDIDYRMIFMRDALLPKSNYTTLEWAKFQGIPAAIGNTIPREWLRK